jgi:hypothetical protein
MRISNRLASGETLPTGNHQSTSFCGDGDEGGEPTNTED